MQYISHPTHDLCYVTTLLNLIHWKDVARFGAGTFQKMRRAMDRPGGGALVEPGSVHLGQVHNLHHIFRGGYVSKVEGLDLVVAGHKAPGPLAGLRLSLNVAAGGEQVVIPFYLILPWDMRINIAPKSCAGPEYCIGSQISNIFCNK